MYINSNKVGLCFTISSVYLSITVYCTVYSVVPMNISATDKQGYDMIHFREKAQAFNAPPYTMQQVYLLL